MNTSNPLVLKNILDNEHCELKQKIDAFMAEKVSEFQQAVQQTVDKVVTERLNSFCTPPNPERLEEMLFDSPAPRTEIERKIANLENAMRHRTGYSSSEKNYNDNQNRRL